MSIIQFVFGFLYTRNWYSGDLELSRLRVSLFFAMLFLVILGIAIISVLQAPLTYESG